MKIWTETVKVTPYNSNQIFQQYQIQSAYPYEVKDIWFNVMSIIKRIKSVFLSTAYLVCRVSIVSLNSVQQINLSTPKIHGI